MFGPEQLVLIITAIIALIGILVPVLLVPLVNFIFTKPFIVAEYSDYGNATSKIKEIVIQNLGQGPATKMTLFVESSDGKIMNVINKFSTQEVFYKNAKLGLTKEIPVNNTVMELKIPQLTQGLGSKILVEVQLEKNSTSLGEGSAVFKEGSVLMEKDNGNSLLDSLTFFAYNYLSIAAWLVGITIFVGLVIVAIIINRKKHNKDTLIKLTRDVAKYRDEIISDKAAQINFHEVDIDGSFTNDFIKASDFGLIKKYYTKLKLRERVVVTHPIDDSRLQKLNMQILFISDKILSISWKRS